MKILCLIDFTPSSLNGLEYAANLARTLNSSLSLLYVRTSIWPEAIQLEHEKIESSEDILAKLKVMAEKVNSEFGVSCHFHMESTTLSFEEAVRDQSVNYDLIVMGTNGADNYYQYVFGSNSFHIIEKAECPVLIVPEDYAYRPIKRIVYAYDPDTNPIFLIDQLKKLALPVDASISVLYVEEGKTSKENEKKLDALKLAVAARAPSGMDWNFESRFSNEISATINQYVEATHAGVLALSFHHRSLLENLFKENTIKQISAIAQSPMFVFWR